MFRLFGFFLCFNLIVSLPGSVIAEPKSKATAPQQSDRATLIPNDVRLNILIRNTVIAVNQANITGNYSVVRDLASPNFRNANSNAQLAEIFAPLRKRGLDFSPILFFDPKLVRPAAIDADGRLRLSGYFDTKPERVVFDLKFMRTNGRWQLFGILIDSQAPQTASTPKNEPRSAAKKAKDRQGNKKSGRSANSKEKKK